MRERGAVPGVVVETVEFDIDSGSPSETDPEPQERTVPEPREPEAGRRGVAPVSVEMDVSDAEAAEVGRDPLQDVQTLGELLQQARENRGLTLEATSARTRISTLMLRHLENDHFGEFAADAYVKGFLRNYGSFLGLDVGMLLRRYEAISGRLVERETEILELDTKPRPRRHPKLARLGWIAVALAGIAALVWIFWHQGAARLGLRTKPGLEQIEQELRQSPPPLSVPGLVPAEPAILLPEYPAVPYDPSRVPQSLQSPSGDSGIPASEGQPLPASPTPRPVTPTERRDPSASPPAEPQSPQPVEDLAPAERP